MDHKAIIACLAAWLAVASALLFIAMGVDKSRARRGEKRIRERTLFLMAALGGALGGVLGMSVFRHKTKHTSFVVGMPLLLVLNALLAVLIYVLAV